MAESNESERINRILEHLGVTTETIRRRRRDAISLESSYGYPAENGYQSTYLHLCGSVSDGLVSSIDQTSDFDFQHFLPVNILYPNRSVGDLPYHFTNQGIYNIENSLSHPLFKRLKYVSGPMTGFELQLSEHDTYLAHSGFMEEATWSMLDIADPLTDFVSETITTNVLKNQLKFDIGHSVRICGPAVTWSFATTETNSTRFCINVDNVAAVRCFVWPDDMTEWFNRKRDFNWPTANTIDRIKGTGCCFVSKGFDGSEQYDIEWRLAFTTAEKILISTFNDTQRKCYVLLKLLHKKYIKCKFPDSVSSYHVKTVMLWVSEETRKSEFRRDRIVECFFMCIDRLVSYLIQCHCPLYFNKSVNLFYKITPETCSQVVTYLGEVKEKTFPKFLHMIDIESIQFSFAISKSEKLMPELHKGSVTLLKLDIFTKSISNQPPHIIQKACIDTLLKHIEVNFFVLNHDVSVIDRCLCDLKSDLVSIAISARCSEPKPNKKQCQLLKAYSSLLPSCLVPETCPAILKRATICYKFGNYSECFTLTFNVIERLLDDNVLYTASHLDIVARQSLKILIKMIYSFNTTKHLCNNVTFSPLERSIVSDIVKEEMDIPKTYDKASWLGWAFIDSIIYAYYLAIMCQHHVSDHSTRDRDGFISELEKFYNRRVSDLFYPETAYRFLQHCKALCL